MRRRRQQLSGAVCKEILKEGSYGILAVVMADGSPYAVPLNYANDAGRIWFHCAPQGMKTDALRQHDRASFCVVAQHRVLPEEYTTAYRSVIAFGPVRPLEDLRERYAALEKIARKYFPGDTAVNRDAVIQRNLDRTCMLEMQITRLTGKQGRSLVENRI